MARLLLLLLSAGLISFSLVATRFRNGEGDLSPSFVLPFAAGVSALLLSRTWGGVLTRAAAWAALAVVLQAAALRLTRAGPGVAYQHLLPWDDSATFDVTALCILASALLLIGWQLWKERAAIFERVRQNLSPASRGVLLALFVGMSATLSRNPVVYAQELLLASVLQGLVLAAAVLAAHALPAAGADTVSRWGERVLGVPSPTGEPEPGGVDRFALMTAGLAMLATVLLSTFVYQRHPHVPDEVGYLMHARYFANGMLRMPLPPAVDAFRLDLMIYEPTRWFSPVPPGWPAVLALGVLLGAPWLVNPILTGLNVLLSYVLLRELYDRRAARLIAVLLAISPWQIFLGMSFMTHAFSLACALTGAIAAAYLRRGRHWGWGLFGGVAIGLVGVTRPLEGVAVALLLGFWTLGSWRRLRWTATLVLALGACVPTALSLGYNRLLTGHALKFPIMAYFDKYYAAGSNDLGFGPNRGFGWWGLDPLPGHSWPDVLINANLNLFAVNVELLGWGAGSLFLAAAFLVGGQKQRADWYMVATVAIIIGIHSFYWFSGGPDFGARYWYLILVPCVALTGRGVIWLARADTLSTGRAFVLAGALSLGTLACFYPWRSVDKYHHYRNMRPDVRILARQHAFGRSLVLIRGNRHPDYASAAIYNPIDLTDPAGPVYVWDHDARAREEALRAYADRPIWVLDGPTRTHGAFRIRYGPISARELRRLLPLNEAM